MKLLSRTWRDLQRLLGPDAWFTYGVVAVLAAVEIAGHRSGGNEFNDLLSVAVLGLVALLAVSRHRQVPLGWLNLAVAFAQRLRAFFHARALDIGVDLRGTPPLPRAIPNKITWSIVGLVCWTGVLLLIGDLLPQGARILGTHGFYLGYLALLVALWAALLVCTLVALVIPFAMIHDACISRRAGGERYARRFEFLLVSAYFGGLLLAASFLPPCVPLVLCGLALVVNVVTIAVPSNPDVTFVWRYRNSEAGVRCIPWGQWVTCETTLLTLGTVNLVLMACGNVILGDSRAMETMTVTTWLGLTLAWLAPGALGALVFQAFLGRLRDPARPSRPVVHISGNLVEDSRRSLQQFFRLRGWTVRFAPTTPGALDVCVEMQDGAKPGPDAAWPLAVSSEALRSGEVLDRLTRRDEIQKRRRLVGGLERLFKIAARYTFKCGSGFWVAPHYWFVPGLSRDTQEDELSLSEGTVLSGIIGPPYHRVLPRAVRHHFYTMLRALQVDLIFVEDGVGFRRFVKILRMMFEVFDVYGGRRRADEVHFSGIPGTRVLIHEFVLDEPFRSDVYPEPDYENLGRARILHIFRDRGEQPDQLETPFDRSHMPAPSAAR